MRNKDGETVDPTDLISDLKKAVSSDDSVAAIKCANTALMSELDMRLLLNIAAVVFSEQGAVLFEKELKEDLICKGLKLLLSGEDPFASDAVTLARYACNPIDGIERELLPGLVVKDNYGIEDKDCAHEIIRQYLVVALGKDAFVHDDFEKLTEFAGVWLSDLELVEAIIREGLKMISQKGIDSSFNITSYVEYLISPNDGLNKPELGRELILKGLEAIQKKGGYNQWDYLPLAELAGRQNGGLADLKLAKRIVLAGLQALNKDHDHYENAFTTLARFAIETFDDRELGKEIVLEGVEYTIKKGGRAASFVGLAEFAINSNTLDDSCLGKEIIQAGLETMLSIDDDANEVIRLAEFAVNKNKYKGLNDIELGRQLIESAVDKAVKDSWNAGEFVELAQFARKYIGAGDTELAREIAMQCLEMLNANENPPESDYKELAEFALSSTDGLGDPALASDILIKATKLSAESTKENPQ